MAFKYLNKRDKDQALTLAAFTAYLDDHIAEWKKYGKSTNFVKYAKMANSFTQKVLDEMFLGVDQAQVHRMVGDPSDVDKFGKKRSNGELGKVEVVVRYKDQAIREYEAMSELDSNISVDREDFLKLIDFALASCELCELCGQDAVDCDMRQLFLKCETDVLNKEPGDGCPYRCGTTKAALDG